MQLTITQLKQIAPSNKNVAPWLDALNVLMSLYNINTPTRIAAFLAQCGHESGDFTRVKENLNYSWERLRVIFPKYFPTDALAMQYAAKGNKQEAIANRVYASRMGNGDEASGDGFRYRGRGLIQLTGKQNYSKFATAIGMPVEEAAQYTETVKGAVHCACWFWHANNLNALADKEDIVGLTKRINGGLHGLDDRKARYVRAKQLIGG